MLILAGTLCLNRKKYCLKLCHTYRKQCKCKDYQHSHCYFPILDNIFYKHPLDSTDVFLKHLRMIWYININLWMPKPWMMRSHNICLFATTMSDHIHIITGEHHLSHETCNEFFEHSVILDHYSIFSKEITILYNEIFLIYQSYISIRNVL